jgi:hypothetical protein
MRGGRRTARLAEVTDERSLSGSNRRCHAPCYAARRNACSRAWNLALRGVACCLVLYHMWLNSSELSMQAGEPVV